MITNRARYRNLIVLIILLVGFAGVIYLAYLLSRSMGLSADTALTFTGLGALISIAGASLIATILSWKHSRRMFRRLIAVQNEIRSISKIVNKPTLQHIAGSVGRTAPLIRSIHQNVDQLSSTIGKTTESPLHLPYDKTATDNIAGKKLPVNQPSLTLDEDGGHQTSSSDSRALTPSTSNNLRHLAGVRAAVILDDFSQTAFNYEWEQFPLTKENWKSVLAKEPIDLLFVESAWMGSGGDWQYQLTGTSGPREEFRNLVHSFRKAGVPTVFWNKEDPFHFDDFIDAARLFDVIFTTDSETIELYKTALGHDRVYLLPFAAQPAVHNPVQTHSGQRDRSIAFGGMYFNHKFPERRQQLNFLLPAAIPFGLDIYARNMGEDPNYEFPKELQPYIRGSLTYPEMLDAYHNYKVVVNANSVVDSPTMFARRIFEATASGAAVVTAPTPGIKRFFPNDEITLAGNSDEATRAYKMLLRSEEYRERLIHRAQRSIWLNHTYRHRVDSILQSIGVCEPSKSAQLPKIAVLISTIRPHLIESIFDTLSNQKHVNVEIILNLHGFDIPAEELSALAARYGFDQHSLTVLQFPRETPLGVCLNKMTEAATSNLFAKIDDDDYYSPTYLIDSYHAWQYSGATVVGKSDSYIHFLSQDLTIRTYAANGNRFGSFVRGATLFFHRDALQLASFGETNRGEDSAFLEAIRENGGTIYGADRFNYCCIRYHDSGHHTWTASELDLLASGTIVNYGAGYRELVSTADEA